MALITAVTLVPIGVHYYGEHDLHAQVACDRVGGGAPELFGRGSRRGLLDFLPEGATVVLNNAHAVRLCTRGDLLVACLHLLMH